MASISAKKRSRRVSRFLLANSASEKLDSFIIDSQNGDLLLCLLSRTRWNI